jgi:integrase/recombinase XerD
MARRLRALQALAAPAVPAEPPPADAPALIAAFSADLLSLGRSPITASGYSTRLPYFFAFLAERERAPLDATTEDVRAYVDALRAAGKSLGTIHTATAILASFYRFCARRGWRDAPPLIEHPRMHRNPPTHVLTPRQVLRILAQPDTRRPLGIRDRALLELLYSTSIRVGELRALRLDDLDFGGGFVRVRRGKGGKWRVVPVGTAALDWVRRYLGEVRPLHALPSSRDALFLSMFGTSLSYGFIQRDIVHRYGRAAHIPFRISPHDIRHASATHLLRGDGRDRRASVLQVRDILGHDSAQTTTLYTRVEIVDLERELHRRHFRDGAAAKKRARKPRP